MTSNNPIDVVEREEDTARSMNNYSLFSNPEVLVHSAEAGASLSIEDANFDGVKFHDIDKVDTSNKILTWIIGITAAAGVITGLIAMYIEASILAYAAFAFLLCSAPYTIHQRRKIQWLPSTFFYGSNGPISEHKI
jgi:hypothetical protein